MIEENGRYLLASVVERVGEGETARLAKEAMERAREEAKRLGLPIKGLLLRTDQGSAFQSKAFRGHLQGSGEPNWASLCPSRGAVGDRKDLAIARKFERRKACVGGSP